MSVVRRTKAAASTSQPEICGLERTACATLMFHGRLGEAEARMYLATVVLLMAILPIGSIAVESSLTSAPLIPFVGKWFVFWGGGVRLLLAGLRQLIQPSFTSRQIFGIQSDDPLPFVQELGGANIASGTGAVLSLLLPAFTLPLAIVGGTFYGIAGVRHVMDRHKSRDQNIATISDLFIAAVLAVYVVSEFIH